MRLIRTTAAVIALLGAAAWAQEGNRPERLEWFRDLGFGLFIHWNFDSQLGVVISHSMVGASDDYLKRFVEDLPKTYNPRKFNPQDWAALAKLAGRERYLACELHGHRYDIGVKYGLLTAQLALALAGQDRDEVLGGLVELLARRELAT